MSVAGLIFDADDTLWETMSHYAATKRRFVAEMERYGFDPTSVAATFEQIDQQNVERLGFSRHRFPRSMAETYKIFCAESRRVPDESVERRLYAIGSAVFDAQPQLFPDTVMVLKAVRPHYQLLLLTKGDVEVQERKLSASGLGRFFDATIIVERKGPAEFMRVVQQHDLDTAKSWSVGDSLRSDINPALDVGLGGVWIPRLTWAHETDAERSAPRFHRASTLSEVLDILL